MMSIAIHSVARASALPKWRQTRRSWALLWGSCLSIAIALGGSAPATAGVKMYQGTLSLHFFGNDVTTGTKSPFGAYVFVALPLGAHCNPAQPGGATCYATSTLQVGAPLTGGGNASLATGSPASIILPANQLGRITSGSLTQQYPSLLYRKTYANLANGTASFFSAGGPGSLSFAAGAGLGVAIVEGKNRFGGVMRLLAGSPGGLGTKARYTAFNSVTIANIPSLGVTLLGAASMGGLPATGTVTGTVTQTTNTTFVFNITALAMGWPWTTGMVTVSAFGDYLLGSTFFPEYLSRTGYDNRTSQGGGTIQLVTPHLINWQGNLQYGAIGVLRLEFVPEPSSGLVLLAGTGLLGVLYRRRKRW